MAENNMDVLTSIYVQSEFTCTVSAVCGRCVFGLYEGYESLWNESCETADTEVRDLL